MQKDALQALNCILPNKMMILKSFLERHVKNDYAKVDRFKRTIIVEESACRSGSFLFFDNNLLQTIPNPLNRPKKQCWRNLE
ncbi:hypothetical protein [Fictibacillus enclensis]|uniref:hypothetical protein n=1 Tax=Fictibacillus enclensis TaxID=1017270 RepID=UPI0024C0BB75|nr:hypothetical protein [Fictibacillus enclensis]WHY74824.1 hypothetical protein QNH15_13350 [Fictibacillus enclensis]